MVGAILVVWLVVAFPNVDVGFAVITALVGISSQIRLKIGIVIHCVEHVDKALDEVAIAERSLSGQAKNSVPLRR